MEHRDMETWRHGNMETWRHGDMATWKYGDTETWRHEGPEARRHGDMKAWRHGDMETSNRTENGSPGDIPGSCKPKFVNCPFVDKETNRSYPFANGINRLGYHEE